MGFIEAEHLFAQVEDVGAVGIGDGRGDVAAVVDGVDGEKVSFRREV